MMSLLDHVLKFSFYLVTSGVSVPPYLRPAYDFKASLVAQMVKNLPANAEDPGWISGLGRSPGEGNGNPLQYSCLENLLDRGAWWAIVHEVAKSWTRLRDLAFTLFALTTRKPRLTRASLL